MRKRVALVTAVLLVGAAACGREADPIDDPAQRSPKSGGVIIGYEVRLRDGGTAKADVQFRLPSGELEIRKVQVPWASDPLTFEDGDVMLIKAEINRQTASPLLCVLASQEEEQGAYVLASVDQPLTVCQTRYELGRWPPDDDDPIGNPLIRVG